MYILRLPFVRTLIFCILVLILLFTNQLNVLAFFLLGGLYSLIESIASKREFDIKTGNKFIDFGWYSFLLVTILLVIIDTF
ncbi:hypothetical protein DTX80_18025 [Bacilli bacterium]|uniref:hypothetical protein n=1 Tax=Oceanobacillus TaxID=182709 RepID=UPI000621FA0D|nr:hypothetical protein WH51_11760 [Bacilli bacterium VT-13-104]PZD81389.1 hypothetical protein DEJ64_17525 [Bacilli bacterium]PZD83213.1 hypothetical protein DEJ60_17580 [Bacilli bacterium]PZD84691.1 hypothetical protein DEJ66_17545 [Bacilli bacterium]RCO04251.1 hypothetical protein DTX80_18025 [Bacilli bacterium]